MERIPNTRRRQHPLPVLLVLAVAACDQANAGLEPADSAVPVADAGKGGVHHDQDAQVGEPPAHDAGTAPDASAPERDAGHPDAGDAPSTSDGGTITNPGSGPHGNTTCLNADGPEGKDTYELIQSILGSGAVENRADNNHSPPLRHVLEDIDDEVGPHFVFLSHSLVDRDGGNTDRSRTEIKVAPSSGAHNALKAHDGDSFTYTWRFRINPEMTFSGRFTHMFQLKSEGGDDGAPILTITGRASGPDGKLEIIHTGPPSAGKIAEASLTGRKGVWLSVEVHATFGDHGTLSLAIHEPDGTEVLSAERTDIDLWRAGDHVRPKWGIYRGLDPALRTDEENVRFANFAITKATNPDSDCR